MGISVKSDRRKARLIISEDKDYIIWIDSERQMASMLMEEGSRMLILTGEDFHDFEDAINAVETPL